MLVLGHILTHTYTLTFMTSDRCSTFHEKDESWDEPYSGDDLGFQLKPSVGKI